MSMKGLAGHIRCVTTHRVDKKRLQKLRESSVPIVIMTGKDTLAMPMQVTLLTAFYQELWILSYDRRTATSWLKSSIQLSSMYVLFAFTIITPSYLFGVCC